MDMISSGATVVEVIRKFRKLEFEAPVCIAVQGLFIDNAEADVRQAGANRLIISNSFFHSTNEIDLSQLLAETIESVLAEIHEQGR